MPTNPTSGSCVRVVDFSSYVRGMVCSVIIIDQLRANVRLYAMAIIDGVLDKDVSDKEYKALFARIKGYIMNDATIDSLKKPAFSRESVYGVLAMVATLKIVDEESAYEVCRDVIKCTSVMADDLHPSSSPDLRVGDVTKFVDAIYDMRARGLIDKEKFGSVGIMENTKRLFLQLNDPLYMASHGLQIGILTVPVLSEPEDVHKRVDFVHRPGYTVFSIGTETFHCELVE